MAAKPIADWKTRDAYPTGREVSLKRWAWEFLRRNADYQSDWSTYSQICREILPNCEPGEAFADDPKEAIRLASLLHDDPRYNAHEPPRLDVETDGEWLQRVGKGTVYPLCSWYGLRYGLRNFPDPFKSKPGPGQWPEFIAAPRASFAGPGWFDNGRRGWRGREVALIVDLALPIEAQLSAAIDELKFQQNKLIQEGVIDLWPTKRNRHAEWPDLLRILDGKAAGASLSELAAIFFPLSANEYPDYLGQKAAEKRLKAAETMAREGYRVIPMLR